MNNVGKDLAHNANHKEKHMATVGEEIEELLLLLLQRLLLLLGAVQGGQDSIREPWQNLTLFFFLMLDDLRCHLNKGGQKKIDTNSHTYTHTNIGAVAEAKKAPFNIFARFEER